MLIHENGEDKETLQAVVQMADALLAVEELESGYSPDIHGQLHVLYLRDIPQHLPKGEAAHSLYHVQLHESGAKLVPLHKQHHHQPSF